MRSPKSTVCEPSRRPTFVNAFVRPKLDFFILVEASLSATLPIYPCQPSRDDPNVTNGSIFVYLHDTSVELGDWTHWAFVDKDDTFEISRSTDPSNLMRERASVWVDGFLLHVESHYRQWDTVNGKLVRPTRYLCFEGIHLRESLAVQGGLQFLSQLETFRVQIELRP